MLFRSECDDAAAASRALFANEAYRAFRARMAPWIDPAAFAEGPRVTREVFRCD